MILLCSVGPPPLSSLMCCWPVIVRALKILVINYSYSYSLVIRRNSLQDCNEPVTAKILFRIDTVIIAPPTVLSIFTIVTTTTTTSSSYPCLEPTN